MFIGKKINELHFGEGDGEQRGFLFFFVFCCQYKLFLWLAYLEGLVAHTAKVFLLTMA